MKVFFIFTWCIGLLLACTYEHSRQFSRQWAGRLYLAEHFEITRSGREVLPADVSIYVPYVLSEVGVAADVDQIHYLCHGFQARLPRTECALHPEALQQAFNSAKERHADYLLWTEIREYGEKSESGAVDIDKLVVYISLYSVKSGALFDAFQLQARGGLILDRKEKPVDLLKVAYEDLAKALSTDTIL